jgi:hypothetical protein
MKLITPILFILISIGLFFVVVNPLRASVNQLRSDIAAYNSALDNSTYLQKTEDKLLETYKNIQPDDKNRLENFLPNTVNNIKFILEVERLANQYNMPIENIKFDSSTFSANTKTPTAGNPPNTSVIIASDPSASNTYGTFEVDFDTQASYDNFLLFLKDLEHNLRLIDIQSISFNSPSTNTTTAGGTPLYTYSLKIQTYWLK